MMLGSQYVLDNTKQYLGYLPNITGTITGGFTRQSGGPAASTSGAFTHTTQSAYGQGASATQTFFNKIEIAASRSSETYGRDELTFNNVIPASVYTLYCIKY